MDWRRIFLKESALRGRIALPGRGEGGGGEFLFQESALRGRIALPCRGGVAVNLSVRVGAARPHRPTGDGLAVNFSARVGAARPHRPTGE